MENEESYKIWVNKRHIGDLHKETKNNTEKYSFLYNDKARNTDIVSLSMPVKKTPYISMDKMHNVFSQNMPSSSIRAELNKWGDKMAGYQPLSDWKVMGMVGQNQIGRVSITPNNVNEIINNPTSLIKMKEVLTSTHDQNVFDELLAGAPLSDAITGNQPKVARSVIDNIGAFNPVTVGRQTSDRTIISEDVIIKGAPHMQRHPFLCMNEYLCSLTARAARIPTALIRPNKDVTINVIQRFDRKKIYDEIYRFGFDSGGTILNNVNDHFSNGVLTVAKYNSSYEKLADSFVSKLTLHSDHINFFKRVAISLILRDGDAHLENFGIIYNKNGVWLSPAYDISLTAVYYKKNINDEKTSPFDEPMALTMFGIRDFPDAEGLLEFGIESCGLTYNEVVKSLTEIESSVLRLKDGGIRKALTAKMSYCTLDVPDQLIEVFNTSFNNLIMEDIMPSQTSKIHQVGESYKIKEISMDI